MFLQASTHFTGEIHWFPSKVEGLAVPYELNELLLKHTKRYGWNNPVVELKSTGNYATYKGYEAVAEFVQSNHQGN